MTSIADTTVATTLTLPNGITIDIGVEQGRYLGITGARLDGQTILVAGRGQVPYFATPDGVIYTQFRLLDIRQDGERTLIETEALGVCAPVMQDRDMFLFPRLSANSGTVRDTLRVCIAPHTLAVGGESFAGFAISYEFLSETRQIHWLLESIACAPGGGLHNARIIAHHLNTHVSDIEAVVDEQSIYLSEENYGSTCIQAPCRGGGSQLFDIIQGSGLAVATYYATPGALKSTLETRQGEDFLTVADFHYQALSSHFITQPRYVVAAHIAPTATREQMLNRWTAWYDYTATLWRQQLGIARTDTVPTLAFDGTGAGGIDPGCTYPELLEQWAERMAWVKAQGFGGIILHTPEWVSAVNQPTVVLAGNNCCPFAFRLSDHLGGDEGLRRFCDVAHAHGIKVYVWTCGHFGAEAPVWKEHPDWIVRNEGGLTWDGHYHVIQAISLLSGGREWMYHDFKHLREATGVDGIWFDSFANMSIQAINYQSPGREPNAPAVLEFLGDLSRLGYEITMESMSSLGVSSWGNLQPASVRGQEEILYNTCLRTYLQDWPKHDAYCEDYYFKALAARAPFAVWLQEYQGKPAPFPPALPEWYPRLTVAYAQVAPHMRYRELLDGGRGALWYDADRQPSAFFAFQDGVMPVDGLIDLSDGVRLMPDATVQAGHIYRIEA